MRQHHRLQGGGGRRPSKAECEFLNASSNIWCEGDLIVSGLFVIADELVINEAAEDNGATRIGEPSE